VGNPRRVVRCHRYQSVDRQCSHVYMYTGDAGRMQEGELSVDVKRGADREGGRNGAMGRYRWLPICPIGCQEHLQIAYRRARHTWWNGAQKAGPWRARMAGDVGACH
jgi:hypothetical protein